MMNCSQVLLSNSTCATTHWAPLTHPRFTNMTGVTKSKGLQQGDNIFDVIKKGDVLVHHPYHSFATSTQHFLEAGTYTGSLFSSS
jgi:polyphosphate kinase